MPRWTPQHLLLAALGQDGGVAVPILDRVGVAPLSVRNKLNDELTKLPKAYGGDPADDVAPVARRLRQGASSSSATSATSTSPSSTCCSPWRP